LFLEPGKVPIHGQGREKLAESAAKALMQAAGLA
jgi:ATP-dependent Lhr-like helicase